MFNSMYFATIDTLVKVLDGSLTSDFNTTPNNLPLTVNLNVGMLLILCLKISIQLSSSTHLEAHLFFFYRYTSRYHLYYGYSQSIYACASGDLLVCFSMHTCIS